MPPRQKATEKATEKAEYSLGDIVTDIKPGHLVRRPDGVVVTTGGSHALNLPGEYAIVAPNGDEQILTVADAEQS